MGMRKKIFILPILFTILLLCNCSRTPIENQKEESKSDTVNIDTLTEKLSFRNPALMAGSSNSDLISLLRRYYINQDFQSMIAFTSSESIDHFGESHILEFYKSTNLLGFTIKLKSIKYSLDSLNCNINYESYIFATKQIKTVECVIENDTAKLKLCSLKSIFCN
jgi:hypothetical protein